MQPIEEKETDNDCWSRISPKVQSISLKMEKLKFFYIDKPFIFHVPFGRIQNIQECAANNGNGEQGRDWEDEEQIEAFITWDVPEKV